MRANWFEGWRLFSVLIFVLSALSLAIAGMYAFDVEGLRMVIRFTARTSLLFFCLAFSAGALLRLWPNAWTRWQRRNRRYLGVTFAGSHALHAAAVVAFAIADPATFVAETSIVTYVAGGIGYGLIIAMAATSFDRTARAIGQPAWRILHLTGSYFLWAQLMVSFGKRVPSMPLYAVFLVPLLAVMAARLTAFASSRSTSRGHAGHAVPAPSQGDG